MKHPTDSAAHAAKELGDLLAELFDATHFAVMHLCIDDHSVLPLLERVLLQAIERCESLQVSIADAASSEVQASAQSPVDPLRALTLETTQP